MTSENRNPETTPVEDAVAALFVALYKLRKAGKYQEAYDDMGTICNMLTEDRDYIRRTYEVKP